MGQEWTEGSSEKKYALMKGRTVLSQTKHYRSNWPFKAIDNFFLEIKNENGTGVDAKSRLKSQTNVISYSAVCVKAHAVLTDNRPVTAQFSPLLLPPPVYFQVHWLQTYSVCCAGVYSPMYKVLPINRKIVCDQCWRIWFFRMSMPHRCIAEVPEKLCAHVLWFLMRLCK